MSESPKTAWMAAIALGYVLGRTKKGKLALTLASVVAGRHFPPNPQELLSRGVRTLRDSPQFGQAGDQLREQITRSGLSALTSAADRTLNSLADAVQQRTLGLENGEGGGEPGEGGTGAGGDGGEGGEAEASPHRRSSSSRGGGESGRHVKKAPAERAGGTAGTAAKKSSSARSSSSSRQTARKSSARTARGR